MNWDVDDELSKKVRHSTHFIYFIFYFMFFF